MWGYGRANWNWTHRKFQWQKWECSSQLAAKAWFYAVYAPLLCIARFVNSWLKKSGKTNRFILQSRPKQTPMLHHIQKYVSASTKMCCAAWGGCTAGRNLGALSFQPQKHFAVHQAGAKLLSARTQQQRFASGFTCLQGTGGRGDVATWRRDFWCSPPPASMLRTATDAAAKARVARQALPPVAIGLKGAVENIWKVMERINVFPGDIDFQWIVVECLQMSTCPISAWHGAVFTPPTSASKQLERSWKGWGGGSWRHSPETAPESFNPNLAKLH